MIRKLENYERDTYIVSGFVAFSTTRLDEFDHSIKVTSTVVVNVFTERIDLHRFLDLPTKSKLSCNYVPSLALRPEFDGGESLDVDILELVGSGIRFGDDDILSVLEVLAELLICWLQSLAVTAPWSVELDQDLNCHLVIFYIQRITNGFSRMRANIDKNFYLLCLSV